MPACPSREVREAFNAFRGHRKILTRLKCLIDVGLDYLRLGQPANTLSGGESQRLKLANYVSAARRGRTLFVLDEPTTGLHLADIQRLLDSLNHLVDAGNSVLVIEHHLDVIKTADWLIDLGPEGGKNGGRIVTQGAPETVAQCGCSYTGQFLRGVLDLISA